MSWTRWTFSVLLSVALVGLTLAACPSGTEKGVNDGDCYWFPTEPDTWGDAESNCVMQDGNLASVPNSFVNAFLRIKAARWAEEYYWIGGIYNFDSNNDNQDWAWMDGTPFNYTNWASGKNELLGNELILLALQANRDPILRERSWPLRRRPAPGALF